MHALVASPPPDNSVVAGPIGFVVFVALIIVVALLCWSFTKQLKKVDKAVEEGVFGEDAAAEAAEKKAAREPHDAEA